MPVVLSITPTAMNRDDLNSECASSMVSPASMVSREPMPTSTSRKPSWDTVPKASTSLRSVSLSARHPAMSRETRPRAMSGSCQVDEPDNPGLNAATRKTPALTMAAECRYALTGVGAVIAPGSQKCRGAMADLLAAPMMSRARAQWTWAPDGGAATISLSRYDPASCARMIMPTSIARPPRVVTSSAWVAARRDEARSA